MANGAWSNGSYIQAGLFDAEFPDRRDESPLHPFGEGIKLKMEDFCLYYYRCCKRVAKIPRSHES